MQRASPWRVRFAYAIWLFGIFGYFVPAATWNPVSRFGLTRAIVEEHSLRIDSFAESTGDRSFRNGHWYSDKAPAPALLAVVPYALVHALQSWRHKTPEFRAVGTPDMPARHVTVNAPFAQGLYVCSASTAGLAGAILGVLGFEVLRRRVESGVALATSMVVVLGTPIMPYATSFYGHVVAAAFLFAGLMLLHANPSGDASRAQVRVAGACLVLAAGSEYIVFGPVVVGVLFAFARVRPGSRKEDARRLALDLAAGAALPLAILGAYHAACFGAPWRTGYSFIAREEFARGHASGLLGIRLPSMPALWGIFFSRERGLFLVSPVLLVGAAGGVWAVARRGRQRFDVMAACVTATLVLMNAGYYLWWGGASVGPRHVVPVLSFLGCGIAAALTSRASAAGAGAGPGARALRAITIVLGAASIASMLVLASVGLEAPETGNILTDYAWSRLVKGQFAHLSGASNLGVELGMAPAASMGPLLAWLLVGARLVFKELETTA
jgi:hypothetical protein